MTKLSACFDPKIPPENRFWEFRFNARLIFVSYLPLTELAAAPAPTRPGCVWPECVLPWLASFSRHLYRSYLLQDITESVKYKYPRW